MNSSRGSNVSSATAPGVVYCSRKF